MFFGAYGDQDQNWDNPLTHRDDCFKLDLTTTIVANSSTLSCGASAGVGDLTSCIIFAIDSYGDRTGNVDFASLFSVSASINGSTSTQYISKVVWDPVHGWLNFNVSSTLSGQLQVSVKYNNVLINAGKAANIVVSPTVPVASTSLLQCEPVAAYHTKTYCFLHLRDRYSNPAGTFETLSSLSSIVNYMGASTCGNKTTEQAFIAFTNTIGEFNLTFNALVLGTASIATTINNVPLSTVIVDVQVESCPSFAQRDSGVNSTKCVCGPGYESASPQSAQPENYCQPCQGGQRKTFPANIGCSCDVGKIRICIYIYILVI